MSDSETVVPSGFDPLLLQVAQRYRNKASKGEIKPPQNVLEWAQRYRRIEGQRFSLERYHPLLDLYQDEHKRIVVMKPAQRGVSEYAVNLACFALEHGHERWVPEGEHKDGLNVGYIFPVKKALEDFAKERINGLKEESSHLAMLFGGDEFDSLGYKKLGRSQLYMRGSYAESDLLSFSADVIILDEYDRMDRRAITLAEKRMNNSLVAREIAISTPTLPGRGISAAYEASDKRVYETECPHCGAWNSYEFFRDVSCDGEPWDEWRKWSQEHIERSVVTLHCPACGEVIDEEARCKPGHWKLTQPEIRRTHGYHVPWWPFRTVNLQAMAYAAVSPEPTDVEELYRSDLGLPYGAGVGAITEELLLQLASELDEGMPAGPWRNTTMGVDIGARLHYRVSSEGPDGRVYVREMGSVSQWDGDTDSLDFVMFRYQVRMCVVDAEPELHDALDFVGRWKGRAMRAFYPHNAVALRGTLWNVKGADRDANNVVHIPPGATDVQVNRTAAMDKVYGIVVSGREIWAPQIVRDAEVVEHMTAPTRIKVADDTGQTRYQWVHVGPDHMFHSCVYDVVARELLPRNQSYAPAVGGERAILHKYQTAIGYGLDPIKRRASKNVY